MIRTTNYQFPSPKVTPYPSNATYYEYSEKKKKRRYSPLCLFLCICCILFFIGIIVGAILLGLLINRNDTESATTTTTTTEIASTRIPTKPTSNGTVTIVSSTSTTNSIITTETLCMPACSPDRQCVKGTCVGTGFLSFTLTWSRPGDGDIVVNTSEGKIIYFGNKGPWVNTSHGWLDVDDQKGTGPENVFWAKNGTSPPAGTYHLCFSQYNFTTPASPTNPITATIKIEKPPNPVSFFSKTFTSVYKYSKQCDSTSAHLITSFTYP